MTRVTIAELKDHLSGHLRAVEQGAEIKVTDRDRAIARLSPLPRNGRGVEILPAKRRFSSAYRGPLPAANWPTDSLTLLLEERAFTL